MRTSLEDQQMGNHEISFNTNLPEQVRTRADFTYKTTPDLISITDTGLGQCSVIEDTEAVLRKIEYWPRAQSAHLRSCAATEKDFGTESDGTAKQSPFPLR
jgi:hypothetical protein